MEFSRLSEGKTPSDRGADGEAPARDRVHQCRRRQDEGERTPRRLGRHLFSAKSISVTALVGGDERVTEAHRFAVTTAL